MNYLVASLWFIFTGLFLYLAYSHWKASSNTLTSLEKFNVKQTGGTRIDTFSIGEVLYALRAELNNANRQSHTMAAKSFFTAGLTAFGSLVISVVQI